VSPRRPPEEFDRLLRAWNRALACARNARRRSGIQLGDLRTCAADEREEVRAAAAVEERNAERWDQVAKRYAAELNAYIPRPKEGKP
jgi:hypothetical protein